MNMHLVPQRPENCIPAKAVDKWIVAIDPAQMGDFSAVIGLHHTVRVLEGNENWWLDERVGKWRQKSVTTLYVRFIDQFPQKETYPMQALRLKDIASKEWLPPNTKILCDATGVGLAVYQIFQATGLRIQPIVFTSGNEVKWGAQISLPKLVMVSTLNAALNNGVIKIAEEHPMAKLLVEQLESFQGVMRASGSMAFNAAGRGHDDLVSALGLCVWYASQGSSSGNLPWPM